MSDVVTSARLTQALMVLRRATKEFVGEGYFQRGVLTRLDQWIGGLPTERAALAQEISALASKREAGTGADINGVALDERGKPSLESLVLHYALSEPELFPIEAVRLVRGKLASHGGPRYNGPWP